MESCLAEWHGANGEAVAGDILGEKVVRSADVPDMDNLALLLERMRSRLKMPVPLIPAC